MKNKTSARKNILAVSLLILPLCYATCTLAATCDPSAGYFCNPLNTGGEGVDTFADVVILAIRVLLSLVGIFALFFLIVGGIKYVVAAGSEENMESAKHTITSALTGLVLALIAYGIVVGLEEVLKIKG